MIREVNEHEFISELVNDNYNSMTYEGAKVLFNWFNWLEESNNEKIEFDRIAIRCDWTEYDNLLEAFEDYSTSVKTFQELKDSTIILEIPESERVVVQAF